MVEKKPKGVARTRNYATIVYPESAPDNWQGILSELCVPAFVSPLHDADKNATGEDKKPHYHVMIMFEGPKTSEQAMSVFSQIGGVGWKAIDSLRGMARYLCHLDNPDKAQYPVEMVKSFSGADYHAMIGLASDKYAAIAEMMDFCDRNSIYSYSSLLRYARLENNGWFRVLCDNGTLVMKEFLKSKSWEMKEMQMRGLPF